MHKPVQKILKSSDIRYRSYESGDFEEVWDLHVTALKDVGAYIECAELNYVDEDLNNIEGIYFGEGCAFIVAVCDGKIVGMGALKKVDEMTAEVKRMRVYKKFQVQGIGRHIYNMLESLAREFGHEKLVLDTSTKQEVSQKFYEKYGFCEVRREVLRDGIDVIFY